MKYTEGEWKVKELGEGHKYNFFKHTASYHIMAEDGVECIATMGVDWASGKAEANAQLIASAPLLYEALKESTNVLKLTLQLMMTPDGERAINSMIEQNEKALAKAEEGK